jgi:hypothetical protein
VQFPDLATAMLALGLGWAALMPLLMYLSSRFDGIAVQRSPAVIAGLNSHV